MVGRDYPVKNPLGLLEAVARVFGERRDVKAVMVGRGFTRENDSLTAQITRMGLSDRVVLAGEHSDIPAVMGAFDIFVLPSLSEGFPNVVAEAMAMRKMCVVTDVGDTVDIIGECGIVVAPGDPSALADGLMAALKLTPDAVADFGLRARVRIQRKFAMEGVVERFHEVYRYLLQRSAHTEI